MMRLEYDEFVVSLKISEHGTGVLCTLGGEYGNAQREAGGFSGDDLAILGQKSLSGDRIGAILLPHGIIRELFLQELQRRESTSSTGIRVVVAATSELRGVHWEKASIDGLSLALNERVSIVRRPDREPSREPLFLSDRLRPLVAVVNAHAADSSRPLYGDDDSPTRSEAERWPTLGIQYENIKPFKPLLTSWGKSTDLIHFNGHGSGGAGVIVQSANSGKESLDRDFFSDLIERCSVRAAIFNTCESAAPQGNSASIAEHVVLRGAAAALGMQSEIRDDLAKEFNRELYRRLFRGESLDEAVAGGRRKINQGGGEPYAIPVLYLTSTGHTRLPDGSTPPAPAPSPTVSAEVAHPRCLVQRGDRVWEVRDGPDHVNLREIEPSSFRGALPVEGSRVVISADGTRVARLRGRELHLMRVRAERGGDGLRLSEPSIVTMPGEASVTLLAVRNRADGGIEIVVSGDTTDQLTFVRGKWGLARSITSTQSVAAIALPNGPVTVSRGGDILGLSEFSVLAKGLDEVEMVDAATGARSMVVASWGASEAGPDVTVVRRSQAPGKHEWEQMSLMTEVTEPPRGVSVVRRWDGAPSHVAITGASRTTVVAIEPAQRRSALAL